MGMYMDSAQPTRWGAAHPPKKTPALVSHVTTCDKAKLGDMVPFGDCPSASAR